MKILMINVVCGIRSTGRICTDLATALEEQGHEVKIAYGRDDVPEQFQKYAVRVGNDLDVKLHALKARLFDAAGFGSKRVTKNFVEWVKEYNPDIIHLHNIHGYYINIEILFNYLRTCGKKIVWTLHDCWAFTGHSAYCDAVACVKWKTGCHHCSVMGFYPKSYVDCSRGNWNRKKTMMTGIPNMLLVAPSKWLRNLIKDSFLSEYPAIVIHNGIDTSKFYPMKNNVRRRYKLDDKFMLLGVASSWNSMKGYDDYLKLSELLDFHNYKIVLVGLSKKQKASLPGNILGIERTSDISELAKLYSAADLYLNLSYCENYPTVNLEALSCGTPVLTYNTGGSPETIENHNGIVLKRGDLEGALSEIYKYSISKRKMTVSLENKDVFDIKYEINNYLNKCYY